MLEALIDRWRERATTLRDAGASQAEVVTRMVGELEAAIREWELAELTLHDAAREGGYSYSAVQQMVAQQRLENVGTKHRPRVRRGDIPRKGRPPRSVSVADEILARR